MGKKKPKYNDFGLETNYEKTLYLTYLTQAQSHMFHT